MQGITISKVFFKINDLLLEKGELKEQVKADMK